MSGLMKRTLKGVAIAAIGIFSSTIVNAQDYPSHPLNVIVAFNPGGGTDVAARTIEPFIEKHLGEDLVIVNKPGAGGEVGFTTLSMSDADGYTLGFINLPAMFAYSYERETLYDENSFAGIANLVYDPGIIAVRSDSDIKTLDDLVKFGKEHPGDFPIGTSGSVGSSEHIAILQLQTATGGKFNHIPFGATAPLRTALLGGHISGAAFNLSEAVDYMKEGDLRILGVMSKERSPMAPDIPTFMEQGVNVIAGSSRGLAAPKGTPKEIIAKLSAAVEKAMNDPEYIAKAKAAGVPLDYLNADEYDAFLADTHKALDEAWKTNPWKE